MTWIHFFETADSLNFYMWQCGDEVRLVPGAYGNEPRAGPGSRKAGPPQPAVSPLPPDLNSKDMSVLLWAPNHLLHSESSAINLLALPSCYLRCVCAGGGVESALCRGCFFIK